jgi:hypothetical protein
VDDEMSVNVNTPRRILFAGDETAVGQYDASSRPHDQLHLFVTLSIGDHHMARALLLLRGVERSCVFVSVFSRSPR